MGTAPTATWGLPLRDDSRLTLVPRVGDGTTAPFQAGDLRDTEVGLDTTTGRFYIDGGGTVVDVTAEIEQKRQAADAAKAEAETAKVVAERHAENVRLRVSTSSDDVTLVDPATGDPVPNQGKTLPALAADAAADAADARKLLLAGAGDDAGDRTLADGTVLTAGVKELHGEVKVVGDQLADLDLIAREAKFTGNLLADPFFKDVGNGGPSAQSGALPRIYAPQGWSVVDDPANPFRQYGGGTLRASNNLYSRVTVDALSAASQALGGPAVTAGASSFGFSSYARKTQTGTAKWRLRINYLDGDEVNIVSVWTAWDTVDAGHVAVFDLASLLGSSAAKVDLVIPAGTVTIEYGWQLGGTGTGLLNVDAEGAAAVSDVPDEVPTPAWPSVRDETDRQSVAAQRLTKGLVCDISFADGGQSESEGRANDEGPDMVLADPDASYTYRPDLDQMETLSDDSGDGDYAPNGGSWRIAFANQLYMLLGARTYQVSSAVGGTSLFGDPGGEHWGADGTLRAATVTRTQAMLTWLADAGRAHTFGGLRWNQGQAEVNAIRLLLDDPAALEAKIAAVDAVLDELYAWWFAAFPLATYPDSWFMPWYIGYRKIEDPAPDQQETHDEATDLVNDCYERFEKRHDRVRIISRRMPDLRDLGMLRSDDGVHANQYGVAYMGDDLGRNTAPLFVHVAGAGRAALLASVT